MNREAIYAALLARVWPAFAWKNNLAGARRIKLWGDVLLENRPALFQFEGGNEQYSWSNNAQPKRVIGADLFVYTDAKAQDLIGSTQINTLLDAIEATLQPTGAEIPLGRVTLGGLVYSCRIEGAVFKDPGDLDGDGMIKVPVSIIVP